MERFVCRLKLNPTFSTINSAMNAKEVARPVGLLLSSAPTSHVSRYTTRVF